MHAPTAPNPNLHRLARFETWARLWLLWFAGRLIAWYGVIAPIPRAAERELHLWLDNSARIVALTIFMRALARLAPRRFKAIRPPGAPPANTAQRTRIGALDLRAAIGGALRALLRGGSLSDRIQTLTRVLADAEALIAKLARRLARGLTRRRPIRQRRAPAPQILSAFAPQVAPADTS